MNERGIFLGQTSYSCDLTETKKNMIKIESTKTTRTQRKTFFEKTQKEIFKKVLFRRTRKIVKAEKW